MAFPDGWSGYYEIVSDYTKIPEVPGVVWIPLSTAPSAFWDALDASGDTTGRTIRVSDTSNALKPCFVDGLINTSLRTGGLFFRDTSLSTSVNTTLRVWSGGAASMPAVTDSEGRNACFASYAGFYLIGKWLTDLTGNGRDMTAWGIPGTAASAWEGIDAATYNGTNQYHHYDGTTSPSSYPSFFEALAYCTTTSGARTVVALGQSTVTAGAAQLTFNNNLSLFATGASSGVSQATRTWSTTNTWHYICGGRDALTGTTSASIDGGAFGTNSTTLVGSPTWARLGIGALRRSDTANHLSGRIAAAYLSASVRSADYVATMNDVWAGTVYSAGAWTANDTCSDGSTGWLLFQTAANVAGGDTAWTDTANALDDDGDYASVTLSNGDLSDYLTLTNPAGVDIPTDATITAVHFRVKREDLSNDVEDFDVKAIKASSRVGNNLAVVGGWPATAATQDYGGDLLGTTWSPTDFGSNFGVAIQILDTDAGADTGRVYVAWCKIDWVCGDDAAAKARGFFLLAD